MADLDFGPTPGGFAEGHCRDLPSRSSGGRLPHWGAGALDHVPDPVQGQLAGSSQTSGRRSSDPRTVAPGRHAQRGCPGGTGRAWAGVTSELDLADLEQQGVEKKRSAAVGDRLGECGVWIPIQFITLLVGVTPV
jgi:hypothetical protein